MKFRIGTPLLITFTLTMATGLVMNADEIHGVSGLQSWNQSQLYGAPGSGSYQAYYWNNFSADGIPNPNQANVGWTLTSGGTYDPGAGLQPLANPPGNIPYYTNGNPIGNKPGGTGANPLGNQDVAGTDAPSNIWYTSAGGHLDLTLEAAITGVRGGSPGVLSFGYYLTDATGTPTGALNPLFSSTDARGTMASITIPQGSGFGYYVQNIQGQGTPGQTTFTFYGDSALNSGSGAEVVDTNQHFAVFQQDQANSWIGAFGQPSCDAAMVGGVSQGYTPSNSPCAYGYTFDYNDFLVKVATPEPSSMALMGGGLIAAAAFLRRRRVSK